MKKIYQLSGTPARPPVQRASAEKEAFQLSKELAQEIRSASRSRFWRVREAEGEFSEAEDFDSPAITSEMKKKYPLLSEEHIAREVKQRIYLHHLR